VRQIQSSPFSPQSLTGFERRDGLSWVSAEMTCRVLPLTSGDERMMSSSSCSTRETLERAAVEKTELLGSKQDINTMGPRVSSFIEVCVSPRAWMIVG